jgi:hypothetical protein
MRSLMCIFVSVWVFYTGGGVAQVVMGSILFPIFEVIYGGECSWDCTTSDHRYDTADGSNKGYDRSSDLAWRTIMVFPAILSFVMAFVVVRFGEPMPLIVERSE